MDENAAAKPPEPVDGKFIFQIDSTMRIRFNADGWVEEIGKGGEGDSLGTKLQGKPTSKRDDIYARRFYDLYARAVLIDIHPKIAGASGGTQGLILFRDLEPGSPLHDRVTRIIAIANQNFGMNIRPLS